MLLRGAFVQEKGDLEHLHDVFEIVAFSKLAVGSVGRAYGKIEWT